MQDLQDLVQDLVSLARKILARLAVFLQDDFYWVLTSVSSQINHELWSLQQPIKMIKPT